MIQLCCTHKHMHMFLFIYQVVLYKLDENVGYFFDSLRTKDIVADKSPLFDANVFGTACTEVELDVLTGNYIIQRMDILYDCGTRYTLFISSTLILTS